MKEHYKLRLKGENNPRYEDGSSIGISLKSYRGEDWEQQKQKIYERDGYSCQKCHNNGKLIHVHHIIPYKISKDNQLTNLVCLCPRCHMKEENFYRQFKTPSLFIKRFIQTKYPDNRFPYIKVRV